MEIQGASPSFPTSSPATQSQSPSQTAAPQHESESNNRRIIVNYLPQSVTQDQFYAMFSGFGTIVSSHLMTDKTTHASLCYGFVEFAQDQDALKAIEGMNGRQMESKRLKVSLARPKSSEIMQNSNLYISGLGPQVSQQMVEALFAPYGTIIDCHLLMDQTGQSRGVAFVRYSTNQEAQRAIASLNQQAPFDPAKPITVKVAENPQEKRLRQQAATGGNFRNPASMAMAAASAAVNSLQGQPLQLLMARQALAQQQQLLQQQAMQPGLTPLMQQQLLQQQALLAAQQQAYLAQFPAAAAATTDPNRVAQAAVQAAVGAADPTNTTVYIYGIPPDANEAFLVSLFQPYGTVTATKVVRDRQTQMSKGFGFVTFARKEDAARAVQTLNGRELAAQPGKPLQVSFKRTGTPM